MTDDYRLDGNQEEISTEVTDLMHLCNCKRCCSLFRALVKYVIPDKTCGQSNYRV